MMSRKFLLATLFFLLVVIGGLMTPKGITIFNTSLMIGGFLAVIAVMAFLNSEWWNKKI